MAERRVLQRFRVEHGRHVRDAGSRRLGYRRRTRLVRYPTLLERAADCGQVGLAWTDGKALVRKRSKKQLE